MRRAMMEAQAQQPAPLPTKFLHKVMEIPIVRLGIDQATGIYGKVKDFNVITHKSFELAEAVTGRVVTPLASKGITLASQPLALHKIDDMAAQGLQTLEDKVPIINKEPKAIVSDVTGAVTEKISATKEKVSQVSDRVLVSRPVQTYFDLLEFVLSTASKTLNKVLPPGEEEAGDLPNGTEEVRTADRGWSLLAQFFQLLNTTRSRFVKRVGLSIDRTSHAADTVFKEAKNAVNNALPQACENEDKNSANGDQQPQKKKKGNQNKGSN